MEKTPFTTILTCILVMALASCEESDVKTDKEELEFEPGKVLIGMQPNTPIRLVFDLMNDNSVQIDRMSGFFNYSTLPNDSLTFVVNQLKDKPYLNKNGFRGGSAFINAVDKRITVTEFFFEMDIEAQSDWLATMNLLKLEELNEYCDVAIKVPQGTEKEWMDQFRDHPNVKWVDLNWQSEIVLH